MASMIGGMLAVGVLAVGAGPATLREGAEVGRTTRNVVELRADGLYKPPAGEDASGAKPLKVKGGTRFEFVERILAVGPGGRPERSARWARRALAAFQGEGDFVATTAELRPQVALLVAERRGDRVVSWSPDGPLTRQELELVQAAGDPMALDGLLPDHPVSVGDRWAVAPAAAKALSDYEALASNTLQATLEALDEATARVKLAGTVRGAVRGGEGAIKCEGSFTFDRRAGRIAHLELRRAELRKAGQVEAGLDFQSRLVVDREPAEAPELTVEALARIPDAPGPERELLLYESPGGRFALVHDRAWHLFLDDPKQTVFKRLDGGELVAQCNLATGPTVEPGRHQDPEQFKADIKQALGKRFTAFLGFGEVDGPASGYAYRVAAQGREGDVGVLWYYYLLASPRGDQLLATFTLGQAQAKAFGAHDDQLIGAIQWREADTTTPAP